VTAPTHGTTASDGELAAGGVIPTPRAGRALRLVRRGDSVVDDSPGDTDAPVDDASDEVNDVEDDLALEDETIARGQTWTAAEIAALWRSFAETGDRSAREQLILNFAPLVTMVAGRVGMGLPSTVEQADLVSYGMFGLIDAVEKFELGRGVKFETYASSRIRGAIIDELRAIDWIPRSVRTKARAVDRAYAELESELRRSPSELEVAHRLDIGLIELRSIFAQLSTVNIAALDELLSVGAERGDSLSLLDTLGGRPRAGPGGFVRDPGNDVPARSRHRAAGGAREDRPRPVLLRGHDAGRDRPRPRGHRVPDLPDAHGGDATSAPAAPAVRARLAGPVDR